MHAFNFEIGNVLLLLIDMVSRKWFMGLVLVLAFMSYAATYWQG